MEVSTTQTPKPNEFVIRQNEVYAATNIEKWEAVEYLMTKLQPVNLEDLDPDERLCAICQQEYHISEDVKLSHAPVRTVCGHIFGKPCLIMWLNPLCYRGLEEDLNGAALIDVDWYSYGDAKTDCPLCRRVLFPKCRVEPLGYLAQRLSFWDMAYASAGVARSEREERSRKILWEYVGYCRSINEQPQIDDRLEYDTAQVCLYGFAIHLHSHQLTSKQQELRIKLLQIASKNLHLYSIGSDEYAVQMTRVNNGLQGTKTRRWMISTAFFELIVDSFRAANATQ